jgi:hypothetical protein
MAPGRRRRQARRGGLAIAASSRVRVRAGVAARDEDHEPGQVSIPSDPVAELQLDVGQPVVDERQAGAMAFGREHDADAGAASRHDVARGRLARLGVLGLPGGLVVREPPGEDHPTGRVELGEGPSRLKPVAHPDPVLTARDRGELRLGAHPLHITSGIGEVAEHRLGLGRYVHRRGDGEPSTGARAGALVGERQFGDLDAAAPGQQRVVSDQAERVVQAGGRDQRVAAQGGAGTGIAGRRAGEGRVAAVGDSVTEAVEPGRPGGEGFWPGGEAVRDAIRDQVDGHRSLLAARD